MANKTVRLVTDKDIPFLEGVLDPYASVICLPGRAIRREDLVQADGLIIRTRTKCDANLLEGTPLRFIATATIGFDHIDTEYCQRKGISWFHAPGCNASGVEQYLAAAILHLAKLHHFNPGEKTIGIVGVGHGGSRVALLAENMGMRVLLNDPPRERNEGPSHFTPLEVIQQEADIITFHVPLNREGPDKTPGLAGSSFFAKLKKQPFIINTSRGEVVDENHLKNALKKGEVAGAVIDTWQNEPNPDRELLALADIGTPHIAGYSTEGKANGTAMCVRHASQFFGFGIDDWEHGSLPPPRQPVVKVPSKKAGLVEMLNAVVRHSYDILSDDAALRRDPSSFEKIRNAYPVRREFPAYTVQGPGLSPEAAAMLRSMGFRMEE